MKPSDDGLGIDFEFSDGKVSARKTFRFAKDSYQSQVTTEVTQDGKSRSASDRMARRFRRCGRAQSGGEHRALRYDATEGKLVKDDAKAAKDGPVTNAGELLLRRHGRPLLYRLLHPRGARRIEIKTFERFGADDLSIPSPVPLRRHGRGRRRRQPLRSLRRPQGHRHPAAR